MATDVEICSSALNELGADAITAISPPDGSKSAELCARFYPIARDAVLRAHPWNFSVVRATLARLSATPEFDFNYQYQLPSDPYCLRVLELDDKDIAWKVEGRVILTDASAVKIRYISRITDTNIFDALFTATLIHRLAYHLAMPTTGELSRRRDQFELYNQALDEGRSMDSQESAPRDVDITLLNDVRL